MERKILIQTIDQLSHTDKDTITLFASIFQLKQLEKNQQLSCQQPEDRSIYYHLDGLLHLYQKNKRPQHTPIKTKINTLDIYQPNQFFTLPHTTPSTIQLKAIRPSQLLVAKYYKIQQLMKENSNIFDILAILQEQWQQQQNERIALLTTTPAKKRYQVLTQTLGTHLYHIPKYLLASYLAISRKQLQRIIYQQLFTEKT